MTNAAPKPEFAAESSWWVWLGALKRNGAEHFVFGCAATCFRAAGWSKYTEHAVSGSSALGIHELTMEDDEFAKFRAPLDARMLKPALLLGRAFPEKAVTHIRCLIQEGLGQTAAQVTTHYTLPLLSELTGNDDALLQDLLARMEDELNLPFTSTYAARLGNFEIFDLQPWLDRPQPFVIEAASSSGEERTGSETLQISRSPEFAHERQIAHVMGRVHGDTVMDRLVILESNQPRVTVESPEWIDQLDFQIYDGTGERLLHSEHNQYLTRINLVMSPIVQRITLEDAVTQRAAGQGAVLAAQAATVIRHASHRSDIGAPPRGSWRKFAEDMADWVAARMPAPSEDKWFPRSMDGELGVIAHLNHLIHGGQVREAVLVDPWFGIDALQRFALRLQSVNVPVTILTSWTRTDPETNAPLDLAHPTERLEAALRQLQNFLNRNFTVINLTEGIEKAFHDRYLLLYPHEGPAKVFLLSNSLNKAAGDWPYCMSLLARDVGREVRLYIEGLRHGEDITRSKTLKLASIWPPHA